ncbi:hypothetical protein KEM48_010849 [Puccinia striiformis f. sp. tritici PST-130]|nr:hypothetical protein KEM48_010849 [Puccinia striiformis f. sp. tritici PST-130]
MKRPSPRSNHTGQIIKVRDRGLAVRLDSGIEGFIGQNYMVDEGTPDMSRFPDRFSVELNSQPKYVAANSTYRKKVETDQYFDHQQMEIDRDQAETTKKKGSRRTQRVIKHPNFHNFNAGQAEQHLANLQRGTVDTGIYQHIGQARAGARQTQRVSLGRILKIGGRYSYSDLDELIVSHVRAMARKVEEMIQHEKTKEAMMTCTYLMANPDRSTYAFCIDKEVAGNFLIGFKANKNSPMQTWNVKVSPGAYELHGTQAGDMLSLCNAFKTQYTARAAAAMAAGMEADPKSMVVKRHPLPPMDVPRSMAVALQCSPTVPPLSAFASYWTSLPAANSTRLLCPASATSCSRLERCNTLLPSAPAPVPPPQGYSKYMNPPPPAPPNPSADWAPPRQGYV